MVLDEKEGANVPHYISVLGGIQTYSSAQYQISLVKEDQLSHAYDSAKRALENDYQPNEMHHLVDLYYSNEAVHSYFIMHNIYTLKDAVRINEQAVELKRDEIIGIRDLKLMRLSKRVKDDVLVKLDSTDVFVIGNQVHKLYKTIKTRI